MIDETCQSVIPQLLTNRSTVLTVRPRNDLDGEILAELAVKLVEFDPFEKEGGSDDRALTVSYSVVGGLHLKSPPLKGSFIASYHSWAKSISLTNHRLGEGYLELKLLDLEGLGIGTYMMNAVVWWAKKFPPDTAVNTITLRPGQAIGDNRERRNLFYEKFGIEFDYDNPETRETGASRPMVVRELTPRKKWSANIVEQDLAEYLHQCNVACDIAERKAKLLESEVELLRITLTAQRDSLEQEHSRKERMLITKSCMLAIAASGISAWAVVKFFV